MKFFQNGAEVFEIGAEVLVPKFTRAEVRLPGFDILTIPVTTKTSPNTLPDSRPIHT